MYTYTHTHKIELNRNPENIYFVH